MPIKSVSYFLTFLGTVLCLILGNFSTSEAKNGNNPVDAELIIAVDVSWSMDPEEQFLQRQGYIDALRSPQVISAIQKGITGKIALTYVEWAGTESQSVIVPWTVIDGAQSVEAFIKKLEARPAQRLMRTSISGALDFSAKLFTNNGFAGLRQIIDVSGDGSNNDGRPVMPPMMLPIKNGIATMISPIK